MMTWFIILLGVAWWCAIRHVRTDIPLSADGFMIRNMTYTDDAVSAPYCWRPLAPWVGRVIGLKGGSIVGTIAFVYLCVRIVGDPIAAPLVALAIVFSPFYGEFFLWYWDYGDAINCAVTAWCVLATMTGSYWVVVPLVLVGFARESAALAVAVWVFAFHAASGAWTTGLLLAILPCAALTIAYTTRKEDRDNRHPLVEADRAATFRRWITFKTKSTGGHALVTFWHTLRPLRGFVLAVPFVFPYIQPSFRCGLLAFIPLAILAIPASGQSRAWGYGLPFLLPFVGRLAPEYICLLALVHVWYWGTGVAYFDETGGKHRFNAVERKWTALG